MLGDPADPATPPNGSYTAVVDRIERDGDGTEYAVLVIERDGDDVGEAVVERATLPEGAQAVDSVVEVELSDGTPTTVTPRPDATVERTEEAQSRFDRLSRRRKSDDDSSRE